MFQFLCKEFIWPLKIKFRSSRNGNTGNKPPAEQVVSSLRAHSNTAFTTGSSGLLLFNPWPREHTGPRPGGSRTGIGSGGHQSHIVTGLCVVHQVGSADLSVPLPFQHPQGFRN